MLPNKWINKAKSPTSAQLVVWAAMLGFLILTNYTFDPPAQTVVSICDSNIKHKSLMHA